MRRLVWSLFPLLIGNPACAGFTASFAEPFSGRKVHQYEVDLPVARERTQHFVIPTDCAQVHAKHAGGASRFGNSVQRSLWHKADRDCHFAQLFADPLDQPAHDYVSGFDFQNAHFSDLPIFGKCAPVAGKDLPQGCPPGPAGMPLPPMLRQFRTPFPSSLPSSCCLTDGVFRGALLQEPGGQLRCVTRKRGPGLRLVQVDYADINRDGYQDAILQLMPLGAVSGITPILLPLTRTEEDGEFFIPPDLRPWWHR